ncbi:MAG: effector binding domain-containing protein [Gammaproteobacteria bacterium]|nr:effector binding domain-containing protein [Gammaproteobacteria bacterium]
MAKIDDFNVVGLSMITSNEAAKNQNKIGNLWDEFSKISIKCTLSEILSSSVFAVYSDYEDGYKGKYRITIGYAVKGISNIPKGLSAVAIPSGNYKVYKSKSQSPEDIIETWKTIWALDPTLCQRNFRADFEEYKDNDVTIYIGYE